MPELPEVEATAQRLHSATAGCGIVRAQLLWNRTAHTPGPRSFVRRLSASVIKSVSRRGKFVIFSLTHQDRSTYLLAHMRMSGRFTVARALNKEKLRHCRALFELDNGSYMLFCDARKFGRLYLVDDPLEITANLGLEPLAPSFTGQALWNLLTSRNMQIKGLLLNQHFIAGIGNIYADEALWRAEIHPTRKTVSMSLSEAQRLCSAIKSVLRLAIRRCGTDFGDGVVCGDFEPSVYGRTGQGCLRCGTPVLKLTVMQRGTHICPKCQRPASRKVNQRPNSLTRKQLLPSVRRSSFNAIITVRH